MTVVREGEPAPDFTLTSDAGRQVTLGGDGLRATTARFEQLVQHVG